MLPPEEELLSDRDLGAASIEQLVNLRDRAASGAADAARKTRAPTTRRESRTRPALD
jgi:hypothetical protein